MPLTSLNVPVNINPKTTNCIISLDSMLLDVAINVYPLNSFNLLISGGFFLKIAWQKHRNLYAMNIKHIHFS